MKKMLVVIFVLVAFQTASYSFWGMNHGDQGKKRAGEEQNYRPFKHLTSELKLTKDQLAAIDKISIKYEKETLPLQMKIKEQRINMREAFLDKNINAARIKEIVRETGKNEIQMKELRVDKLFEVLTVLNTEQREKLRDLRIFSNFLGGNVYDKQFREGNKKDRKMPHRK
ncbi:MAG TPA: hypothetical protein DF296_06490 [Candidatus Margulisbacteria bacterium]|nr:MAG: hypothetical protein A2X43_04845 [Candidatus Margulisbacteria bacterium GWD2_39_127]OGI03631.1 MAG: hypothetical protein A2X42_01210 [Candidatus Margulisbacteria bacterium GWF2_38_17]OGI11135.1 MAG: hypothetical protein A2X41_02505 [Candidatus Margulisbacteria bacterium GWE2_39_32]HAR64356.1 hypothetical protein [Candidatus Margulisiibacteriota bacterium]HCT84831.1 hypothetical protein [Candidatus Margulisiibacteriota bacterium]